ncbi:hypothetical protein CYMTET_35846 [Cymbomonas tetramitiformis]|uniref:Uncharacterized protein n=1 Tax=Cymbomonas tetramitiformis TaxID=36881 RepID=A0AAE0KNB0_9CHLO|nr:hypothetical protein CYMTET_35846 [Cymbomonas tetramitiformis]
MCSCMELHASGAGDLAYLAKVHCLNFVILLGYFLVAVQLGLGLQGIWFSIILNQILRMMQHTLRICCGHSPFPVNLLKTDCQTCNENSDDPDEDEVDEDEEEEEDDD